MAVVIKRGIWVEITIRDSDLKFSQRSDSEVQPEVAPETELKWGWAGTGGSGDLYRLGPSIQV